MPRFGWGIWIETGRRALNTKSQLKNMDYPSTRDLRGKGASAVKESEIAGIVPGSSRGPICEAECWTLLFELECAVLQNTGLKRFDFVVSAPNMSRAWGRISQLNSSGERRGPARTAALRWCGERMERIPFRRDRWHRYAREAYSTSSAPC
jgi:hypothetical protein